MAARLRRTHTTWLSLGLQPERQDADVLPRRQSEEVDQSGVAAYSAYPAYDVGDTAYNQSYLFSVTHSFNSNLLNNTKLSFARFNVFDSYEKSLTQVPNLMFVTPVDPYTNGTVQLPGLFNSSEPGLGGLPYGGPQNTIQFEHDLSWTKGRHNMRFGGSYLHSAEHSLWRI